jgi:outer membrane protein assembly factor BamD (BamD/ComL family)
MNYLDFSLEIGPGEGGAYIVRVIESPVGRAEGAMRLPFDEVALDKHLTELQIAILSSSGQRRADTTREEKAVREFGRILFDSTFSGGVREHYAKSLEVANKLGQGLRLKLNLKSPEIASLPWEFLYDPSAEDFVCLSRKTPVVRYIGTESSRWSQSTAHVNEPLRIFGVAPRYRGMAKLEVENEQRHIEEAVARLKSVELVWFKGKNWRDLHRELEHGRPWHIFHFIGHGSFDEDSGQGTIRLTGDRDEPYHMNAKDLGRLLEGHSDTLKMVVLNSCEGARASRKDVFSSVAAALVQRGVPVALAMQYRISDWAAIEFARSFYTFVAEGLSVEAAVAEARKSITLAFHHTVEWGTPVLYMRTSHGQVFDVVGARQNKERREEIFELYDEAKRLFKLGRWREARAFLERIRERHDDYRDVDALLEEAEAKEAEEEAAQTLEETKLLISSKDWPRAIEKLQIFLALRPDHAQAAELLNEINRQKSLDETYHRGHEHFAAGEWEEALKCFEEVSRGGGGYDDVGELLARARGNVREKRLAELYREAERAGEADDWNSAIEKLRTILSLDPLQEKAQGLLFLAEQEKETSDLYKEALKLYKAECLDEAFDLFTAVKKRAGDYKRTPTLIKDIKRRQEEAKRQVELAEQSAIRESEILIQHGRVAMSKETWLASLEGLTALQAKHPGLSQISYNLALARRELFGLEQQERIAATYADGQELYRARRFYAAWARFNQIRDSVGKYAESDILFAEAQRELFRRYRQQLIAGGAAVVLASIVCASSIALLVNGVLYPVPAVALGLGVGILLASCYFLYSLIRDSNDWRSEIRMLGGPGPQAALTSRTQGQTGADDQGASAESSQADTPAERLSKRLGALLKIDDSREIDSSYITCAEYVLFVDEMSKQGKYYYPDHWLEMTDLGAKAAQPVSGVRYKDAVDFCRWLTEKEGKRTVYRIPSLGEAVKNPAVDKSIAAWCSDEGRPALVGLPTVNKRALRDQIRALDKSGLPLPPRLGEGLLVSHDLRGLNEAQVSMASALSDSLGLISLFTAQELSQSLISAAKSKLDADAAHGMFVSLAQELNLKSAPDLLNANARSLLLFEDDDLVMANRGRARTVIREVEKRAVEKQYSDENLVRSLRVMTSLLDIADAETPMAKRRAQKGYALLVLQYILETYARLRKGRIKARFSKKYHAKLMRLRLPNMESVVGEKKLMAHQKAVLEFYWWLRIIDAREFDELPAWEGIRIVREVSDARGRTSH